MTLLQASLMWICLFTAHAQAGIGILELSGRPYRQNVWASVFFASVVSAFVVSLVGPNGVY